MTISATVTQAHLDAGKRHSSVACAVALAIKETISVEYTQDIQVHPSWVLIRMKDGVKQFNIPVELRNFILDVDAGRLVQVPHTFELQEGPIVIHGSKT